MIVLTHKIAGITFRMESEIQNPYFEQDLFEQFRVDDVRPDVCFRMRQLNSQDLKLPPLDKEERELVSHCIGFRQCWLDSPEFCSPEVRTILCDCLVQPEMVKIEIVRTGMFNGLFICNFATNNMDYFYPPENRRRLTGLHMVIVFRNLLSRFLVNFSGVMIHSSGVIHNDAAALFLASDGGGKTTALKSSKEMPILNDDQIILRKEGNIVFAHGTPFGQISNGPNRGKVGGFFLLEKASCFDLNQVRLKDVFQFLWNEHLHRWHSLTRSNRIRTFDIVHEACSQALLFKMKFSANYVNWAEIQTAMERNTGALP